MKRGITIIATAVLMLAAVLAGFWLDRHLSAPTGPKTYNTSVVVQQIQTLSQLVTVKYVLEKIVIVEDAKWYGDNRVLLLAHGVVKAGIDLQKVQAGDLQIYGDQIRLKIPQAAITDVYLDEKETQVVERSTGLMRSFDKDLEQNARKEAVDALRQGARLNGIIKDANERAKVQLEHLFSQLGFTKVEIVNR